MSTGPVLWHPFIPGYDACDGARVKVRVLTEASRIRILSTPVGLWHTLYLDTMPVTRARAKVRVLTEASRIRIMSTNRIMASIIPGYDACDQGKGEGESAYCGQQDPDYMSTGPDYGIHYTWIRSRSPGQG
jgi:hypothetical protein